MRRVLDTNVVLQFMAASPPVHVAPGVYFVSFITELELLSFPRITSAEEESIVDFLKAVNLVQMNPGVRDATIELRRRYALKLPDAIICATAIMLEAELFTNDLALNRVSELIVLPYP